MPIAICVWTYKNPSIEVDQPIQPSRMGSDSYPNIHGLHANYVHRTMQKI